MARVCCALSIASAAAMTACVGSGAQSATAPTPGAPAAGPATPAVTMIVVSTASLTPSTYQLSATARLSDASLRDVTMSARWESTNTAIATVTSTGLVASVAAGSVDIHATYQGVMGSATLTLARPPGASAFAVAGLVGEVAPNSHPLAGVRVQISAGPDFGRSTTTASDGSFRFPSLTRGLVGLEASKDGYLLWRIGSWMLDEDKQLTVSLFPNPPNDEGGVTATARCIDRTWSWAKLRMLACTDSDVAYVVCPGPLCAMPSGQ